MGLTRAQERAAVILLSSGGGNLILAGGGALIVHGLVDRRTEDLDVFTRAAGEAFTDVASRVRSAFEAADYELTPDPQAHLSNDIRTWLVRARRTSGLGRRPEVVKIQICRDNITCAVVPSRLGPLVDPVELGANKILTIYDRPRHRDFDDVARIAPRIGVADMIAVADTKVVTPLDKPTLAMCVRDICRLDDKRFPDPAKAPELRSYFADLADRIEHGRDLSIPTPYEQTWTSKQAPPAPKNGRWRNLEAELANRAEPHTHPLPPAATQSQRCGVPTRSGDPCRNHRGSCPHHRAG